MQENYKKRLEKVEDVICIVESAISDMRTKIESLTNYSLESSNSHFTEINEDFPNTFLVSNQGDTKMNLETGKLSASNATIKFGCCCCHCHCNK